MNTNIPFDRKVYSLYDKYLASITDEDRQLVLNDNLSLRAAIIDLCPENTEIAYYLMLHHWSMTNNVDPAKLVGVRITFYSQKQLFNGKGISASSSDITLICILKKLIDEINE